MRALKKTNKILLLMLLCMALCFVATSCKKKNDDAGKKPSTEQSTDKDEIELPEDTLGDKDTAGDDNSKQETSKNNTSSESSKENSKEPSNETPEETPDQSPAETPSDEQEQEESRAPIVLPSMKLD